MLKNLHSVKNIYFSKSFKNSQMELEKHLLYKEMEVDSVISNVFKLYLSNFWKLFIMSFLGVLTIQLIFYYIGFYDLAKITNPDELIAAIYDFRTELLIGSLSYVIVYGFLFSIIINYLLKLNVENDIDIGLLITESFSKYAVHMIFFLILSLLIYVVGAFIGVIALFIGFFVALFYLGTVLTIGEAIVIAEDKNAIEAIGRSFQLAHKDFWSALGSFVIFILILIVISIIMSAVMSIPLVFAFVDNFKETGSIWESFNVKNYDIGMWSVVLNSVVTALTFSLYPILSVVLYFKLKYTEDKKNIKD